MKNIRKIDGFSFEGVWAKSFQWWSGSVVCRSGCTCLWCVIDASGGPQ